MTMDHSCHFLSYKGPDLIGPFFCVPDTNQARRDHAIFAIFPSDDKSPPRYVAAYTRPATLCGMNNSSGVPRHFSLYISIKG